LTWSSPAPFAKDLSLAQALLEPTRIYIKPVLPLMKAGLIKGGAHITGGGLIENPDRGVREDLTATLDFDGFEFPPVFKWLMETGGIDKHEMLRTFNCGIGFVLYVSPKNADAVLAALLNAGEDAFVCGQLTKKA
jgi:phosphoribosylformylglycinamidine cyclo-ligase